MRWFESSVGYKGNSAPMKNQVIMAKTIKIAPDLEEIQVTDTAIQTDWNGGFKYEANIKKLKKIYGENVLKESFRTAVAFSSKPWQLENALNKFFKVKGKVS